jgi:carbonic anhydrase
VVRSSGEVIYLSLLNEILEHNDEFVAKRPRPISKSPAKKVALFTCMDTRLVEFLEPAMGLKRGDAKVIKSAGNSIVSPYGTVIRSLVVAIFGFDCEEIYVIGHRDCGMTTINDEEVERKMLMRGVPASEIAKLQPSLREWLGAFQDPVNNVARVVSLIRANPFIPNDVPVHGLIFDPDSGRLDLITQGYPED